VTGDGVRIARLQSANIRHILSTPIHYGDWVMRHREFVLVSVQLESGLRGFSYGLTREGPVSAIIGRSIAPKYVGCDVQDPASLYHRALWSNHAVHAAGIGMRALSLVDLAVWDALAKSRGVSIHEHLAPGRPLLRLPATAIVGYPPSMSPDETQEMVRQLGQQGWTRFKIPIAPDIDLSVRRLQAAREVAPDAWIGFDANMVFRSVDETLDFERRVRDLHLGWIEDLVPPGDAQVVAAIRERSGTPVAMGDEQGGAYHPRALLDAGAVDVLRVDATTNGGITGLRQTLAQAAGRADISPHMFPHIHARLAGALGLDVPIEWGVVGTGVHPMDDGLERPTLVEGRMEPLSAEPGFGDLVDLDWISHQEVDDVDGLIAELEKTGV
jgi:L-alanine-DL-glutamate epimerase-like enolase superfamily enzyme